MKRGRFSITSSNVSYAIGYTASTFMVFMKLSALALSYGLPRRPIEPTSARPLRRKYGAGGGASGRPPRLNAGHRTLSARLRAEQAPLFSVCPKAETSPFKPIASLSEQNLRPHHERLLLIAIGSCEWLDWPAARSPQRRADRGCPCPILQRIRRPLSSVHTLPATRTGLTEPGACDGCLIGICCWHMPAGDKALER